MAKNCKCPCCGNEHIDFNKKSDAMIAHLKSILADLDNDPHRRNGDTARSIREILEEDAQAQKGSA